MASAFDLTNYFGPISACVIGAFTLWRYRAGRAERAQARLDRAQMDALKGDANLREDQVRFINVLQSENAKWRVEVEQLRITIGKLRDEIDQLRHELATERRAREASEARYLEVLERRPVDLTRQPPAEPDA